MNWSKDIQVFNEDCMLTMSRYPDNYFDLAIVDPPYGINIAKEKPRKSGRWNYKPKKWDEQKPTKKYFKELFRVSKNQIIWGGNYFDLKGSRCYLIWDKQQPVDNFADAELAWTSFDKVVNTFRYPIIKQNFNKNKKIHPTQKPISLYQWLYKNYAKPGFKIIDTHYGSGSNGIALDSMNKIEKMELTLVASEIDKDYYNDAKKRFDKETAWQSLFD